MTTIQELKALQTELKNKMKTEGASAIATAINEVFEKHPEIKAIGWQQYTPYFNDGDACVFGMHGFYYSKTDVDPENVIEPTDDEPWIYASRRDPMDEAVSNLECTLDDVSELMKAAFGDHVYVIATRAGFHVGDYDHE